MATTEASSEVTTIQLFDDVSSGSVSMLRPLLNNSSSIGDFEEGLDFPMEDENMDIDCMGMPQGSQSWSIVCEGILSVIVGVCGLMGNGATIAVLTRPNFKETFHKLLICLSCFDSLFIGSAMLIYSIRAYGLYKKGSVVVHFIFMALFPIGNVALYGSIYITLAVSIERFLGVVYPMQSRTRPRRNLWAYLLPVLVLAIGFNIPKALEFRLNIVQTKNETIFQAGESELARDLTYTYYYKVWSNLIITTIVPITVLVLCNTRIFVQLRRSRKEMLTSRQPASNHQHHPFNSIENNCSSSSSSNGGNHGCQSPDYNLAMILAGIVIVFAVCHSLRFFLAFYNVSTVERTSLCLEKGREAAHPSWLYVISALNHLMLMVNSSINFVIYCAVGSRFRQALAIRLFGHPGLPGCTMHSRAHMDLTPLANHGRITHNPHHGADLVSQVEVKEETNLIDSRINRMTLAEQEEEEEDNIAITEVVGLPEAKALMAVDIKSIQTLSTIYGEQNGFSTSSSSHNSSMKTHSAKMTDL